MIKNILCFGDSNTWGYTPLSGVRYLLNQRWPNILQNIIGSQFHVVEEGLNGRTIANNEANRSNRSGLDLLPVFLESHRPIDLVIVMLGTNDLKQCFNQSMVQIKNNIKALCLKIINNENAVLNRPDIKILLVSPSHIANLPIDDQFAFQNGSKKSKLLAKHFQQVAKDLAINFFDADTVVKTTDLDGIHWTVEQHQTFAEAISLQVKAILKN